MIVCIIYCMQSFTFVTAIIDIKSGCHEETLTFKMEQLHILLNTLQAPITIFADRGSAEILNSTYKDRKNITIILFETSEGWKDSWIYRASLPYMDRLPLTRNLEKDTFEHICLTHLKIEFLQRAIENQILCWIDPHICHLFTNPLLNSEGVITALRSINYLNYLSQQKYTNEPFLALPGCWDPKDSTHPVDFNTVCWRFCSNFMIGDAASIRGLHTLYKHFYPTLLKEKNTMTWDMNFLAQLESEGVFNPKWYKANHDASIVRIPTSLYSQNLENGFCVKYDYPEVPGFFPSSASYVKLENKSILITRYVNYQIGSDGRYTVFHPSGQLQTRNLISVLSDDFTSIRDSQFLDDSTIGIPTYLEDARYVGLEDVRTFICEDGSMEFVASSAAYTPDHSIRIVRGAIRDGKIVSGVVLQPPNGIYTSCEKNWIPILGNKTKSDSYIYRWHPYEIVCSDNQGITKTVSSKVIPNTLFEKVRGSTAPIWSDSCYICVVHWTNGGSSELLEYYHMLVKLDETYNVMAWSQPFHFTRIGIQYCLGFTMVDAKTYGFWFSENDGNPQFMRSCSSQFSFVGLDGRCVA
jgi:hypothetical protein